MWGYISSNTFPAGPTVHSGELSRGHSAEKRCHQVIDTCSNWMSIYICVHLPTAELIAVYMYKCVFQLVNCILHVHVCVHNYNLHITCMCAYNTYHCLHCGKNVYLAPGRYNAMQCIFRTYSSSLPVCKIIKAFPLTKWSLVWCQRKHDNRALATHTLAVWRSVILPWDAPSVVINTWHATIRHSKIAIPHVTHNSGWSYY